MNSSLQLLSLYLIINLYLINHEEVPAVEKVCLVLNVFEMIKMRVLVLSEMVNTETDNFHLILAVKELYLLDVRALTLVGTTNKGCSMRKLGCSVAVINNYDSSMELVINVVHILLEILLDLFSWTLFIE